MPNCQYFEPKTVDEACALLAEHGANAKLIAGGQVVTLGLKTGRIKPSVLISLKSVTGLRDIQADDGNGVEIGALVTHRQLENSDLIRANYAVLAEAEQRNADLQIRNAGTIGGALAEAHPASDIAAALIALEASAVLRDANGERRVAIGELVEDAFQSTIRADEILTYVEIAPYSIEATGSAYEKFVLREGDFAVISVAAVIVLDEEEKCADARIVLGNCMAYPVRAGSAEQRLLRSGLADFDIEQAGRLAQENIEPRSEPMASSDYKRHLIPFLVRDALKRAIQRAKSRGKSEGSFGDSAPTSAPPRAVRVP